MKPMDGSKLVTAGFVERWAAESLAVSEMAMRRVCGRAYRASRQRVERTLHPWRRGRALGVLAAMGQFKGILVVCRGNVCRSPFAAAVLRRLLRVPVMSAGFIGPSRRVPAPALQVAASRSIDLDAHRSQLVTRALLDGVDLVLVMDEEQATRLRRSFPGARCAIILLGDLDPELPDSRTIADPWGKPASEFERVYARIERCCRVLADASRDSAEARSA